MVLIWKWSNGSNCVVTCSNEVNTTYYCNLLPLLHGYFTCHTTPSGAIAPEGVLWLNPYYILLPNTTITTLLLPVTTKFSLLPIVHLGTWLELLLINASLLPINALTRWSRPGWTMGSNEYALWTNTAYFYIITAFLQVRCTWRDHRKSHFESCGQISAKKVSELCAAALLFAFGASHFFGPPVSIQWDCGGPWAFTSSTKVPAMFLKFKFNSTSGPDSGCDWPHHRSLCNRRAGVTCQTAWRVARFSLPK